MGLYEEGSWRTKTTDSVVCPKPRRLGLRLPFNHRVEMGDAGAGMEIIGIIHPKGRYVGEISSYKVSSSPPFFSGSPPTRASNPIIQDAYFVDEKRVTQPSPSVAAALALSLPTSSSGSEFKGGREGCVRSKFRNMQAEVRIEGFDCLNRDGRNCSISAMA